ncbi:MFS transporter [Pseudonocardia nematodicida]|uniref:MFS transporter n=1 Tax=Pseudonocardia nematodicida TaxID=1206997 RepID=A0ABV1K8K9_9PSEU
MSTAHAHYVHAATGTAHRATTTTTPAPTAPADRGPSPVSRLGGPEALLIWTLATVFVVWLFSLQTGYGIVSPDIQQSAGLSVAQISLAASVYTWVFAICQFFSGSLLDRYGSRPLMTVGVALVTIGAFLFAGTTGFGSLVLAQAVMALGAAFGFVGAGYIGGHWFEPARYGLMFGLVQTFASLGSAVGQPAIAAMLGVVTWQQLLGGFGGLGVLLVVLFAIFVRNPDTPAERAARAGAHGNVFGEIVRDLGRCFTTWNVNLAALMAGASFGTMLALGVLWGPRVMEARGAGPGFAAVLTAAAWLGLAVGAPLANVVSNRWNSRRMPAAAGTLLQALAVALVIYLPTASNGASIVLMFCVGLFAGAHMLGFTVAGESVSGALIGSSAAIVNGVCFIIGGVLQAVPGALLPENPTLDDFRAALWLMPAVLVLGAVAALLMREPRPATGVGEQATAAATS